MSTSYVLISCELGCESAIMDEIRTIRGVEEVCGIYGCSYDIIIKVTDDSQYRLENIIRNIRRITKVKSTQTMIAIEGKRIIR
ncbi:MAG TPA: Lrp/AsnC ligand binding domain-containing protein [Nitrososphaeraceae archaeon]|jgi:DNA-binding Lrp family transcriptional regulator